MTSYSFKAIAITILVGVAILVLADVVASRIKAMAARKAASATAATTATTATA